MNAIGFVVSFCVLLIGFWSLSFTYDEPTLAYASLALVLVGAILSFYFARRPDPKKKK